jgi:TRAP-type C4-dicarboxylate transport system substrate-binding protein
VLGLAGWDNDKLGNLTLTRLKTIIPALIATAMSCSSALAEPLKLTFTHFLGPNSFFQTDLVEPWARELEERTKGAVQVEVLNSSSPLGNARKQATQVADGTADIALGLRGAEGDRFLGTSVIELPFVVPDAEKGSRALWSLYEDGVLTDEYKDFKVLALFVQNPGLVHTKDKRVTSLSDLQGLRLRVPNTIVSMALESVGAVPAVLLPDEIIPALKANKLDGIVTNWGTPIPGFNDVMKQHTAVPFYAAAFFIVMNKQRFEALPDDVKQAIDAMSGDTLVGKLGGLWNQWDKPFFDGAHASDHEIVQLDPEQLRSWQDGLQPVADRYLEDLEKKGFGDARVVYEDIVESMN